MGSKVIVRPAYDFGAVRDLAEAANLIAAEAKTEGCTVRRPFNGVDMEGRPDLTAAHVVMWWEYDIGCRRETRQRAELDALTARANAAKADVDRLTAELAQAQADCRTLAGLYYGSDDDRDFFGAVLMPAGLTDAEVDALDEVWATAVHLSATEGVAILRRALAGGAR